MSIQNKFLVLSIFGIVAILTFSCDLLNDIISPLGSITGKAVYNNSNDNSGIIISLERNDEGLTRSVQTSLSDSKVVFSKSLDDQTTTNSLGEYNF